MVTKILEMTNTVHGCIIANDTNMRVICYVIMRAVDFIITNFNGSELPDRDVIVVIEGKRRRLLSIAVICINDKIVLK